MRSRCAVRFEEGPDDDCRYSFGCCAILDENSAYHYVSTSSRIGHPSCRCTDRNRRFVCNGHRRNDNRLISFGCRCGNGRRPYDSHRHSADNPVLAVARYPDSGRIAARLDETMYSQDRSGEPEPSLYG